METVRLASYSILINGEPRGHITPTRGIKQGDPFSLYLFLLCAKGLSSLLRHAIGSGQLHAIASCQGGVQVSHLLFANNSLLFCKATPGDCQNLLNILALYEVASGQTINRNKTSIFFSRNTKPEMRGVIRQMLGAQVMEDYEKYLGLPMVGGKSKERSVWEVGDGRSIGIRSHKWLPHPSRFKDGADQDLRTAYQVAFRLNHPHSGEHSFASQDQRLWKKLLSLNMPPKVRTFMWRACYNVLPTKSNLAQRKVQIDSKCSFCGKQDETIQHILWEFPFARNVWALVRGKLQKSNFVTEEFFMLARHMVHRLGRNDLEPWAITSWSLWNTRNRFQFKHVRTHPCEILQQAESLLEEY
ncbi:hypothetical protein SO802_020371 [Lithocarpus litseifolius]|uniref:Reverse transcriptase zinc-binding domain-containing protein n=1 Tax=Lithocarpus litseifolius TaxID=425828 RepID=A0AAW2CH17_9ROSI